MFPLGSVSYSVWATCHSLRRALASCSESTAPLSLTLSSVPGLDVTVGELRDGKPLLSTWPAGFLRIFPACRLLSKPPHTLPQARSCSPAVSPQSPTDWLTPTLLFLQLLMVSSRCPDSLLARRVRFSASPVGNYCLDSSNLCALVPSEAFVGAKGRGK